MHIWIVAMALIDKLGRKPLLAIGVTGVALSMFLLSYSFNAATYTLTNDSISKLPKEINVEQIYVLQGRVDEYERFIRNIDFVNVTDEEIENTMFASAEQFYLTNNLEKAIESFKKYLERFHIGFHRIHRLNRD